MAQIESCSVEECPYRNEHGRCGEEHNGTVYVEWNDKLKQYEATLFCSFNFYEDEETRIDQRNEILSEDEK